MLARHLGSSVAYILKTGLAGWIDPQMIWYFCFFPQIFFRLKGKIRRPFHFSNVCSVDAIAISETIDDNEMLGDARHLKSG